MATPLTSATRTSPRSSRPCISPGGRRRRLVETHRRLRAAGAGSRAGAGRVSIHSRGRRNAGDDGGGRRGVHCRRSGGAGRPRSCPRSPGARAGRRAGTAYSGSRAPPRAEPARASVRGIVTAVGARRAPARAGCALLAPLARAARAVARRGAVWSRVAATHRRRAATASRRRRWNVMWRGTAERALAAGRSLRRRRAAVRHRPRQAGGRRAPAHRAPERPRARRVRARRRRLRQQGHRGRPRCRGVDGGHVAAARDAKLHCGSREELIRAVRLRVGAMGPKRKRPRTSAWAAA